MTISIRTRSRTLKSLFLKSLYQLFCYYNNIKHYKIISEKPENWRILHQYAFSFSKTTLILSELLPFKNIWCPSGKNFAFSSNPPCKLQLSKVLFASWILLVLHYPFTYAFYNIDAQMHHPYVMQGNAALHFLLQKKKNALCGTQKVKILWGHYDLLQPGLSWWDGVDHWLETDTFISLTIWYSITKLLKSTRGNVTP